MTLLYILDLIGTAAFAASGAFAGVRRNMDLLGVMVLGTVTAIGGGTLRDILLGDLPPFCLQDETYLYLSLGVALAVFHFHVRLRFLRFPRRYFDAIGLGTFLVIGTQKAIDFELGFISSVILGTMTATAGGVLRDVLANQVPLILQREFYASCCIIGGVLMVLLHRVGAAPAVVMLLPALTVLGMRLAAIRYNWALPKARGL